MGSNPFCEPVLGPFLSPEASEAPLSCRWGAGRYTESERNVGPLWKQMCKRPTSQPFADHLSLMETGSSRTESSIPAASWTALSPSIPESLFNNCLRKVLTTIVRSFFNQNPSILHLTNYLFCGKYMEVFAIANVPVKWCSPAFQDSWTYLTHLSSTSHSFAADTPPNSYPQHCALVPTSLLMEYQ